MIIDLTFEEKTPFTLGGLRVAILMLGLHQSLLTTMINLVALFEEIIGFFRFAAIPNVE